MLNGSLAERLNGKLHRLFVLATLAYVAAGCFRPMLDNVDIGWHVAQGRWMIEHGAIYRHDALNYPNLGHPVIDEYPLFQVVVYLAYTLGWWGPCLLTATAYVALFVIFFDGARRFGLQTSALFAASLGFLLLYLYLAFPLRPHIATYLGIAAFGVFLLQHRRPVTWTEFWPLAALQVAWTNCHSGFVIGPGMVALFGAEMIVRESIQRRAIVWPSVQSWLGAFLFVLLACFVNPFGPARFYPPFFQEQLESIRAYVGEMQPLSGGGATLYDDITLASMVVAVAAVVVRREMAWSFFLLLLFFHHEALEAKKAWPVYGLFLPLVILSASAFATAPRRVPAWLTSLGLAPVAILMTAALISLLRDGTTGVQGAWRQYDAGYSELALDAPGWMKLNGIDGRLFHRCEDGGWLQQEGFDHGETFADTGFGKYDAAFIHEVGLVGERPALVPRFLDAYRPAFVVCGDFCFQWPYYLRQAGWRLIFYSPNSMVWTRPGVRDDLPTVSDRGITTSFLHAIGAHGRPDNMLLFGRDLIALNSLGLGDFAFDQLTLLPKDFHRAPWYWEAARTFASQDPPLAQAHIDTLLREADALHDDTLTAPFRAYALDARGDTDGALRVLEAIPPAQLSDAEAELLLKIDLERNSPAALDLARRTDCWSPGNGHHWQYLAEAEAQAGHTDAAAKAWRKAVFYYPDDGTLIANATAFAAQHHDTDLQRQIDDSAHVDEAAPAQNP